MVDVTLLLLVNTELLVHGAAMCDDGAPHDAPRIIAVPTASMALFALTRAPSSLSTCLGERNANQRLELGSRNAAPRSL